MAWSAWSDGVWQYLDTLFQTRIFRAPGPCISVMAASSDSNDLAVSNNELTDSGATISIAVEPLHAPPFLCAKLAQTLRITDPTHFQDIRHMEWILPIDLDSQNCVAHVVSKASDEDVVKIAELCGWSEYLDVSVTLRRNRPGLYFQQRTCDFIYAFTIFDTIHAVVLFL